VRTTNEPNESDALRLTAPRVAFRVTRLPVPLRRESKRGLIALAVLCAVALATFAAVGSSGVLRRGGPPVASRLKQAK
jgi:hypothetical protein